MLKRIIACTLLLLLSSAAALAAPTLEATPSSLSSGTFTIPLTLHGDSAAVAAVGAELTYDPAVLELAGTTAGPAATAAGKQVASTPGAKGHLTIGVFGFNTNKIADGVVATVTFKAKAGQEQAAKSLTYVFSASNPAGDDLALEQARGTLVLE